MTLSLYNAAKAIQILLLVFITDCMNSQNCQFSVTYLLASTKWYISVLDHMPYLPSHCDEEQHQPVEQQDGPEHRNVENGKQGQGCPNQHSLGTIIPAI